MIDWILEYWILVLFTVFFAAAIALVVAYLPFIRASRLTIDLLRQHQSEKWVALGRPSMGLDASFAEVAKWVAFLTKGQFEDIVDSARTSAVSARRWWFAICILILLTGGSILVMHLAAAVY